MGKYRLWCCPSRVSYEPVLPETAIPTASWGGWTWQKLRRYSRIVTQAAILGLDILFTVGKTSDKVPAELTKATLTGLSLVGFGDLPYSFDLIVNSSSVLRFGCKAKHFPVMLLSAIDIVLYVSSLGLLTAGLAASIIGLKGDDETQSLIYKWMTPIGQANIILSMLTYVVSICVSCAVIKKIDPTDHYLLKWIKISYDADAYRALDSLTGCDTTHAKLAALLALLMDKDTKRKIIKDLQLLKHNLHHLTIDVEKLEQEENIIAAKKKIMDVILNNIKTMLKYNVSLGLAFTILAKILMWIEKVYTPNSLVSAWINLSSASLYTLKILKEVSQEMGQRQKAGQVVKDTSIQI